MATLFDSLSQSLNAPGDPLAPKQKSVEDALRAKSGKATGGTGPGASNLGEQAALDTGGAQLGQQQQQGALMGLQVQGAADQQAQQATTAQQTLNTNMATARQNLATQGQAQSEQTAGQEQNATSQVQFNETQKTEMLNVSADQKLRELAAEKGTTMDNIFREFDRSEKDLAFRQDAAHIEQVGFTLSMRDKAYLDELNRIGAERDLKDKLNFQEETNRVVLGDQLDRTLDDIGFKKAFNSTQRDWDQYLGSLDAENAVALAMSVIRDDGQASMISGANQLGKAGVDAYYKYDSKTDPMVGGAKSGTLSKMENQDVSVLMEDGTSLKNAEGAGSYNGNA